MKDEVLIRMLEETCTTLQGVSFPATTPHLIPSYNALLAAAQANHPNDAFLNALLPLDRPVGATLPEEMKGRRSGSESAGPEEMRVLFGQLRIVLESYQEPQR